MLEKETRIRESMLMMGLQLWVLWTTWFIKQFVFLFISAFIMALLLKVSLLQGFACDFKISAYVYVRDYTDIRTCTMFMYVICTCNSTTCTYIYTYIMCTYIHVQVYMYILVCISLRGPKAKLVKFRALFWTETAIIRHTHSPLPKIGQK